MAEPTRTIAQRELRNNVSAVLREVERGTSLRITVGGRPVADLVPIDTRRRFVPREIVERIIRQTPLDAQFAADVASAVDDRVPDSSDER